MLRRPLPKTDVSGFSMIEVLVALVITVVGLLGLAGLILRMQTAEMESYQRAQALVLVNDMKERIAANHTNSADYVITGSVGTSDSQPASCTALAPGSAARDVCEWSNALKGSNEKLGAASTGAMIGARGCIIQIQPPDPTTGICQPAIYEVSVAWQGVVQTAAPSLTCGQNLYGLEGYRRVVSARITIGLPQCQSS